ncbi:MAG: phosphopantetheine-binding protein [Deferribacteraceae bacterium]|jgi:acyl carrier protein|nr:phosphopantetheine-binding protein [Deferribacteraceae bacterium]
MEPAIMKRVELENEIKNLIVSSLDLEDILADDIVSDAPLFVEGLGLDSIDALELGMVMKKKYQLQFKTNNEENKELFRSVRTIADFIAKNKQIILE